MGEIQNKDMILYLNRRDDLIEACFKDESDFMEIRPGQFLPISLSEAVQALRTESTHLDITGENYIRREYGIPEVKIPTKKQAFLAQIKLHIKK